MPRISKKELDSSSVTEITSKPKLKEKTVTFTLYDKVGNIQSVLPSDQIMAQITHNTNKNSYYVRVNRNRELYDPHTKGYAESSYLLVRDLGVDPFEMVPCDKETFNMYVNFLSSKDKKVLHQVQRKL